MSTSLLEIPDFRTRLKRFTIDEYHSMGNKGEIGKDVELIQGYIVKKMSKSPLHTRIVYYIFELFYPLRTKGFLVRKEDPISIFNSEPEPDISILKAIPNEFDFEHPKTASLVIEVAVTSYEFDLTKLEVYASANIPEVWIIVTNRKEIEVYSDPSETKYITKKILSIHDTIQFENISIKLADIYSR